MASREDIERFQFLCREIAARIREHDSLRPNEPGLGDVDYLLRELAKSAGLIGVPVPVSLELKKTDERSEFHITIQHVGDICRLESGVLWSFDRKTGESDFSELPLWRRDAVIWLERWARHAGSLLLGIRDQREAAASPSTSDSLTFKEQCIVDAPVEHGRMTGQEIADTTGYKNNSWFRQSLSNLVKRGYLDKAHGGGYILPDNVRLRPDIT